MSEFQASMVYREFQASWVGTVETCLRKRRNRKENWDVLVRKRIVSRAWYWPQDTVRAWWEG